MSEEWGVRARLLLDRWFILAVALAVALLAVGGYAAYTAHEAPGTTTEQRQVSSWTANGTYGLSATVSDPNPLYPVGTRLSDRPAYFISISPVAEGTFRFSYRASDGGSASVRIRQTLVLRAIDTRTTEADQEQIVEYWRLSEPLGTREASDVSPGQTVEASFDRNVNRTYARMENVSEQLGGTPGSTQMLVVADVAFEGTVNGNEVSRTARYRLPITVSGSTYRPAAMEGESLSGSTAERVTRQRTYGPLYRIGGPVAAFVGLVGLFGLVCARYDDRLSVPESRRTAREVQSTRDEFDEWITTATLPPSILDRPRIEIDSLEGLVDTAIDVDARVFEDSDGDAFYVPADGVLYVYTHPSASLGSAVEGEGTTDDGAETDDARSDDA